MPKELSPETIAALIAKHGPNLEVIDSIEYLDEPIVLRPPTPTEWRLAVDQESGVPEVDRESRIVDFCVVYPPLQDFKKVAEGRPALYRIIGGQIGQMAGAVAQVKRKKLQPPSATTK